MPPCLRSPDRDRGNRPRQSKSPPQRDGRRQRSVSLPVTTLPLRGCCKACIPAVDAYLASPTVPENMTSGAKRLMTSSSQHLSESKVIVDEVDMIRKEIRNVTICESAHEPQRVVSAPQARPPLKLNVGARLYEEADEDELFPLPSPSPRNSPRQTPLPSPVASQTNLATLATKPASAHPIVRGNSPLAKCCSTQEEKYEKTTAEILREEVSRMILKPELTPALPKSENPPIPKLRRPSFTGIGLNISKSSLAIVKGLSGIGVNASVGHS